MSDEAGPFLIRFPYLICFDFPEVADPLFAGWTNGVLGLTPTLKSAVRFKTWEDARRSLTRNYDDEVAKWGAVVEMEVTA